MEIRLSIDRFKREKKEIAVLLTDAGASINLPKALLPKGVKPGDILSVTIEKYTEATRQTAAETRKVQNQLKKTDPGGDLRL